MKTLFILNNPPYGTERSFKRLPLAEALSKEKGRRLIFFIGDAAACAKKGQKVPQGFYNLEVMRKNVSRNKGEIGVCGTCMDARGIINEEWHSCITDPIALGLLKKKQEINWKAYKRN